MKMWITALVVVVASGTEVAGQSNAAPVRLAVVIQEPSAKVEADLLTVELSARESIQLLERTEIEKVHREQGLSSGNAGFLKLGQILGADGLLLVSHTKEGTNRFLAVRLVAVKPGVVLGAVRTAWPLADASQWAKWIVGRFAPLFPKLSVMVQDAVPISVVNLRAAVRSTEAQELERQLTLLAIERLTREKQFFVLERREMNLLSSEKELASISESAFWNGSYLLEGVLDRDRYSKDRVTINARLVPPGGGVPIEVTVAGSRAHLGEVIDQLADRVLRALHRGGAARAWKPEEEAANFYEEAKWALKWGMIREAQTAAEAAWALGKRDLDSAVMRVKSYVAGVPPDTGGYQRGSAYNSAGNDRLTVGTIGDLMQKHQGRVAFERRGNEVNYLTVAKLPDAQKIAQARHALELYEAFSHTLPPDEPKVKSSWYLLGIQTLEAGSQVLQHFHFVADSQTGLSDSLAELRARARAVAAWISRSPSVRETYWVGERGATHDELRHSIQEGQNIFKCKMEWGCFWQDKPEGGIALYRELMSSPVFVYLHAGLWFRPLHSPRLAAWTAEDRKRLPDVWRAYLQELNASIGVVHQIEGRFLQAADASSDEELEVRLDAALDTILANREAIVTHNVELLYLDWGIGEFVHRGGVATPAKEALQRRYASDFQPRFAAVREEYAARNQQRATDRENLLSFEKQKQYLANSTSSDIAKFHEVFRFNQYSKTQAAELQLLLAAYKSNLTAEAEGKMGQELAKSRMALGRIQRVEGSVNRALNPPASALTQNATSSATNSAPVTGIKLPGSTPLRLQAATNALLVKRFFKMPVEQLRVEHLKELDAAGSGMRDGKLVLDLHYSYWEEVITTKSWGRKDQLADATALFDPQSARWEIIKQPVPVQSLPADKPGFTRIERVLNSQLLEGVVYSSLENKIGKYDLRTSRWESMPFPAGKQVKLFVIHNRLFGANGEGIFELLDGGKNTRVLASCRRKPALSTLDALESLGQVTLLPGPVGSLRAAVQNKLYSWDERDWKENHAVAFNQTPQVFEDGTVLRSTSHGRAADIWLLPHNQTAAEWCWHEKWRSGHGAPQTAVPSWQQVSNPDSRPTWSSTRIPAFARAAVTTAKSNLYFYTEHFNVTNVGGKKVAMEKDGRHANLVCLERGSSKPLVIPLKFDLSLGPLPTDQMTTRVSGFLGVAPAWMVFAGDFLFIGHGVAPGLWAIPKADLDSALAQHREAQSAEGRRLIATKEQLLQTLLAKYDHNHNGVFDPDEREPGIDDPMFIEHELQKIDLNHDGRLDAEEVSYFDSNRNGILEPREDSAIDAAQRIFATRFFEDLDTSADARIDHSEFAAVDANNPASLATTPLEFISYDRSRDGYLDIQELESFLKQRTLRSLRSRAARALPAGPVRRPPNVEAMNLKAAAEAYWESGRTRKPPTGGQPGPSAVPAPEKQTKSNQ